MISSLFPPVIRMDETGDVEMVKRTGASFACVHAWSKGRFILLNLLINNQFLHMACTLSPRRRWQKTAELLKGLLVMRFHRCI